MRRSVCCLIVSILAAVPAIHGGELAAPPARFALAIHGGAGVIPKSLKEETKQEYLHSLRDALTVGRDMLAGGASSLDTVQAVVRFLEDDPRFNAGKGAVYNHEGGHELDAAIMDGRDLSCGAVAGLTTVRNPIDLARLVMERTPHVFLAGDGAEEFATLMEVARVEPDYYFTPRRYEAWKDALEAERKAAGAAVGDKGTVGAVALDGRGNLAAATSTGGLTNKRLGRIGDVPVIGAGTYADNRSCAVSGTGVGEEFIRNNVAHDIAARMRYRGDSLEAAVAAVIQEVLSLGDGGVIAVDRQGNIVMRFNTEGMFRGAADSSGRFEVAIWE
ncbi:MAG: isoaspartyl peptidase/L-asparaginase [Acidobacteriota bacterium]|jgi:beta-aspartyl-peptidase (threonine type)